MILGFGIFNVILGIIYGIAEKDFGGMFAGIFFGSILIFIHIYRKKNAESIALSKQANAIRKAKEKAEKQRYQFYLSENGKKELMQYVDPFELETYSWDTIAHSYATEQGQQMLQEKFKEEAQAETQEDQEVDDIYDEE